MTVDYLTCGECLKEFPLQNITLFIQHKKLGCDDDTDEVVSDPELRCNNCPQGFMTAWSLLVHAQLTHNLKIFLENATKTVLKKSKLPQTESSALIPVQTIKNAEAAKTNSGEHKEMISVDQKPSCLSDTDITINVHSRQSVTKERDKTMDVPPQVSCPVILPQHSSKLGSNLTVTKNSTKIIEKEPNQTHSPEKNLENNSTPKKMEPIKTSMTTNISKPLNIYQLVPSTGAVDQNSIGTATSLPKSQLVNANIKVLPAAMITSTSKNAQSNPTDEGSILMLQNQISDRTSTESVNVTKTSQSSPQSLMAKQFPGIIFQGEQPKLIISEDDLTLKEAGNTSNEVGKSEGQDSSQKQCLDEIPMDVSSQECCDSQDCGVKVIPGSHEHLKKCCNAVVPKKRKRHMELKHMPFAWSSSRYASRKLLHRSKASSSARSNSNQLLNKTSANTIYIDLEPDSVACDGSKSKGNDETSFKVTQSSSALEISTNETSAQIPVSGTQNKQRSLILKPCSIFSIPLTYAIPASQTASNVSKSNPEAANSLADSKLESGSGTSSTTSLASLTSTCRSEENQSTVALQQTNTMKSPIVRNDGKVSGRSRQTLSKPFKCDKCPSAFNQRIHLQKHMSKHTGIKPYKCGECNYATVERSHLKVHIRIHTGEKPFKCTYCEYATAQNSTLKIHLKRHHGGKMFHCGSCDKQFTQKEQLRIHEWEHGSKAVVSPEPKMPEDVQHSLPAEDFNQDAGTCQPTNQMNDDNS